MIALSIFLLALGIFLSAFFSGCETGFYRATRARLVLDALGGDPVSRALLWMTNNPALFVATTLIGNNVANYITSHAIVLAVTTFEFANAAVVELLAPVLFCPVVFVYGELLPKFLFYHAPNVLLRRGGPLFLMFATIFAPISAVLWMLGRILESLVGQAPLRIKLTVARHELQQILREGQQIGLLQPAQSQLAHSVFAIVSHPVAVSTRPLAKIPTAVAGTDRATILALAREHHLPQIPIAESKGKPPMGYVRVVDLRLDPKSARIRRMPDIRSNTPHLEALILMQGARADVARVVDERGNVSGLLFARDLVGPLF